MSPPTFFSSSVTARETTETNVLLTWVSSVDAPTSVIFGAIAFAFSLTKYVRVGRVKFPEVMLTKLRLKSGGMMMDA